MTDPLSLLRRYNIGSIEIIERNNQIIFGEISLPKNTKTAFRCKSKDSTVEYYTLECLLYYLKNYQMHHVEYFHQAAAANIPAVRRPDRTVLLKYLYGQIDTCDSIDKSDHTTKVKRTRDEVDDKSVTKKPRTGETHGQKGKKKRKMKRLATSGVRN